MTKKLASVPVMRDPEGRHPGSIADTLADMQKTPGDWHATSMKSPGGREPAGVSAWEPTEPGPEVDP